MSRRILEIQYKCMHPSCVVNCREGVLAMDEELYNDLLSSCEGEGVFKSPRGACRMGFSQKFQTLAVEEDRDADGEAGADAEDAALDPSEDPVKILVAEHQVILEKLDEIEGHMRRRDCDALWVSTAEIQNEIMLHSVHKEEDVLFPLLHEVLPLADGLITVVKEDHRELMTLLHSFRIALVDGDILDGIGRSIVVNLRSHIRKEDEEFFMLIDRYLDADKRKYILEGMKKVEESFEPIKPVSRQEARKMSTKKERNKHDDDAFAAREARQADAGSGGGCCHG